MPNDNIYTAITVGPIYDTISLTSSPVGLWAASYLFSHLSRRICEMLVDKKIVTHDEEILSPYFDRKKPAPIDGIGRYPDHIVFLPNDPQTVLVNLRDLFHSITNEIAGPFGGENVNLWFKQYLQLHAFNFTSKENPLLDCGRALDAIELEKTFPTIKGNPIADLLDSSEEGRNKIIRDKIRASFCDKKWPFPSVNVTGQEDRLPDMEDITGHRRETTEIDEAVKNGRTVPCRRKINAYYAIVQTDGDHFGEQISKCRDNLRGFSKKCLDYCSASAEIVKKYGGIPIYAGGDDLLFIAPLTRKEYPGDEIKVTEADKEIKNILDLLVALRQKFDEIFWKKEGDPTLSLGVAIRYYKYPLYEALDEAYKMLFRCAKKNRNAAAISLRKRSGRDVTFVLENFKNVEIVNALEKLMEKHENQDMIQSAREKIWEFKKLFEKALDCDAEVLNNVFLNTFDCKIHNMKREDIDLVQDLLKVLPNSTGIDKLELLDHLLRFARLWGEKGDEKNG